MSGFTAITLPAGQTWGPIAYGGGVFVVVSVSSNTVAVSKDGGNWTLGSISGGAANWGSVVYGGGQFVAVSWTLSATSADGLNWTTHALPGGTNWGSSVVYGGGTYLASDSGNGANKVITSTDGANWTAQTMPSAGYWNYLAYGNGTFVALSGSPARSAVSANGAGWSASTTPFSTAVSIAFGAGIFVASGTNLSYTSPDGVTWTARTPPTTTSNQTFFRAVDFLSRTSSPAALSTSTDGITWVAGPTVPNYNYVGGAYGGGITMLIGTGAQGAVYPAPAGALPFWTNYQRCFETDS